jgi:LysR family transcriptional regulator, glycine cleavage system transcriptional activator
MKFVLPPMHTLRTFEAVGRLRHFARAAEELHLTASAVSHQIRAIESFCAVKLLQRNRHEVVLTPAGEKLMAVERRSLEEVSATVSALRARDASRLAITVPPSLASRWLMPRLGAFLAAHAQIDFSLHASAQLSDLDADSFDLAIRYGSGRWKGLHARRLFGEQLFAVASPAYVAERGLRGTAQLKRGVLLRDDFRSWPWWFEQTGVDGSGCALGAGFDDSALLLQAAEAGQGVALARSLLVEDALTDGRLVRIGRAAVDAPESYYLVASTRQPESAAVEAFRHWLIGAAER